MPAEVVVLTQATQTNVITAVSAANTAAATSAAIDLTGYEGVVTLVCNVGAITGSCTPSLVTDSASGGGFATTVTTSPAFAAFTANTNVIVTFDVRSVLRYVKFIGTIATGPTLLSVTLVGFKKVKP